MIEAFSGRTGLLWGNRPRGLVEMPTGHMCAKARAAVRLDLESLLYINWFY